MLLLLFDLLLFQLYVTVVYDLAYVRKCLLVYCFESQTIFFKSSMEVASFVKVHVEGINVS